MSAPKPHRISIRRRLDKSSGKWVVTVTGITSGAKIHTADELTVEFKLDASRYEPFVDVGQ